MSDFPPAWSLISLDSDFSPTEDLDSRKVKIHSPPPSGPVGLVTGPVSKVWAGPVEGAPVAVACSRGSWGLYPARGRGRKGWWPIGTVVPLRGTALDPVQWICGSPADLVGSVGGPTVSGPGGWERVEWPPVPDRIPWGLGPSDFSEIVESLAGSLGYAVSGVGLVAVGLAAGCLMGRSEVVMMSREGEVWREKNPALYTMLVDSSSGLKSPVFGAFTGPIQDLQVAEDRKGAKLSAEDRVLRARAQATLRNAKADEAEKEEAAQILASPEVLPTALITDNATPAAIADVVARQTGLLYISPDAANFFAQCVGDSGADIKALLNAYSGDPAQPTLRMTRQGAPAAGAPLRMGVIAATQPGELYQVGLTAAFTEQGLLARILWALRDEPIKPGGQPFDPRLRAQWNAIIHRLVAIPSVHRSPEGVESGSLREIRTCPEGTAMLLAFRDRLRDRTAPGSDLHLMQSWCGKAHGQAARIAGVFTLIADPKALKIPLRWVEAAIRIAEEGLLSHAVSAWTLTRWPPATGRAVHLWCAMKGHEVWTRAKIASHQGLVSLDPADITAATKCLVDRGFLREAGPGIWLANPLAEDPYVY